MRKLSVGRNISKPILAAAILLRVVIFIFLNPTNNDDHGAVVKFLVAHGWFPTLWDTLEAQHPPLFYLLCAPLWKWTQSDKGMQLVPLACSVATLLVLHHFIYRTPLIENARARLYAFLVICFLPQFVMFTLYVSNDTLTILLGSISILQAWRYIQSRRRMDLVLLAVIVVLGFFTKLIFLAYLPVFAAVVYVIEGRSRRALLTAALFFGLTLVAGSYKLVDNYIRMGDPLANGNDLKYHNLNIQSHTRGYRGIWSYIDVNIFKLIRDPIMSDATIGSLPSVLYGTFWYQYIPESNFILNRTRPSMYIGSAIYIAALLPTLVFIAGWGRSLKPTKLDGAPLARALCSWLILFTGLLFLPAELKHHIWSQAQGRYLFPVIAGGAAIFGPGVDMAERSPVLRRLLPVCMGLLVVLFFVYFGSECWYWLQKSREHVAS
jgi:hypothetical protein